MSRLIDADALLELYDVCEGLHVPVDVAIQNVKDMPTVEEPVRHGHWMHDETGANYCSECHKYPYDDGEYHLIWHTNYCPHCGARMDGKEQNNDIRRCRVRT